VAQEVDGGLSKDTLLENLENLAQVTAVGGCAAAGDEDVVQIDDGDRQATKQGVHELLKSHARVFQAEWHADKLEQPEWGYNGCLGNVSGGDRDLQVAFLQIHLAENSAAS
jgi:hypothetical protein